MILVNFSHPLTPQQVNQVQAFTGQHVERIVEVPTQFDDGKPFAAQVEQLLAKCTLSTREWQTMPILVVLPAHNVIAATLLAKLHGLTGYFPSVLRLRPCHEGALTRFEVAEVINLETVREEARKRRY